MEMEKEEEVASQIRYSKKGNKMFYIFLKHLVASALLLLKEDMLGS